MKPKTHTNTTMTNPTKKMTRYNSSPFPACFRPPTTPALEYPHAPPPTTATTTTPNLTTCLYQTNLGLFSLTWSRSLLARTLHLHLHSSSISSPLSPSFHLTLKPFIFWTKHGHKKLPFDPNPIWVFWDFSHAKFGPGPGPEPESGYYIGVVSDGVPVLVVGDMEKEFYSKTKLKRSLQTNNDDIKSSSTKSSSQQHQQSLVVRREHVFGNQFYTTRTDVGGKLRVISIELNKNPEDDPRLVIRFDNKRVLQVKHLKWKFRGSERVEIDGHRIQLSWDVYNWLFEEDATQDEGYALFTFRFEKQGGDREYEEVGFDSGGEGSRKERVVMWSQDSCGLSYERKKMKKKLLVKTRSSSSSSLSSVSSSTSSSIMEWESVEENELKGPTGFSLLVYAWKS